MRARNIKPGFFSNDLLAECQMGARVLFIGLWTIADREGRLVDRPAKIKAQILPFDNCNVDELLNELAEKHEDNNGPAFIVRYRGSDGHRYIQILNFKKHQNPHVNEASSEIPAPEEYSTSTVQTPGEHTTNPAESLLLNPDSLLLNPESLLLNPECGILNPETPASILSILAELKKVKDYPFEAAKDIEYLATIAGEFPGLDLLAEAKAWAVYKLDKPLEKKSNPRSQFRRWCQFELEKLKKGGNGNGRGAQHGGNGAEGTTGTTGMADWEERIYS